MNTNISNEFQQYLIQEYEQPITPNIRKTIMKRISDVTPEQISGYIQNLKLAAEIIINRHSAIDSIMFQVGGDSDGNSQTYFLDRESDLEELIITKSLKAATQYFKTYYYHKFHFSTSDHAQNPRIGQLLIRFGFKQHRPLLQEIYTFLILSNALQQLMSVNSNDVKLLSLENNDKQVILDESSKLGKDPSVILKMTRGDIAIYYQTKIKGYCGIDHTPDISLAVYRNSFPRELTLNNVTGIIECKDLFNLTLNLTREFLGYLIDLVPLFFIIVSTKAVKNETKNQLKRYGIVIIDRMDPLDSTKGEFHSRFSDIWTYFTESKAFKNLIDRVNVLQNKFVKLHNFETLFEQNYKY